jgi:prepilin-type N-terminal cleavage/methylation domain-containing protein
MKRPPRTRNAGFTMLEITVAISLMSVIGGAMLLATETTSSAMKTGAVLSDLDIQGGRALDMIAERLASAKRRDIFPAEPAAVSPFHTSTIDFQGREYVAPIVVLDDLARIEFEMDPDETDNGVDDNGNGLIDEGIAVLTTDIGLATEMRTVIVRGVSGFLEGEIGGNGADDNGNGLRDETGLSFDFNGDRVTIRLTLVRADKQALWIERTFERTVALRK